jgi:protein SCO1/2
MKPLSLHFLRLGLVVIGALLIITFLIPGKHNPRVELRSYASVPPFSLTERSGRTITNADLVGKVWVADFIFTTCPGPCPIISANMEKLQTELDGDPHVQLVSFTVDPQDDTPAVLATYADNHNADPKRWWFLTGPEKPLYELIQNGFYQAVQDNHGKPAEPGQFLVTHSTRMVLVDTHGMMRGLYDGLSGDDRKLLLDSIHQLEREQF